MEYVRMVGENMVNKSSSWVRILLMTMLLGWINCFCYAIYNYYTLDLLRTFFYYHRIFRGVIHIAVIFITYAPSAFALYKALPDLNFKNTYFRAFVSIVCSVVLTYYFIITGTIPYTFIMALTFGGC